MGNTSENKKCVLQSVETDKSDMKQGCANQKDSKVGFEGINVGLEGIVVGETRISNVEGDIGRLSYRGVDITELAGWSFVAVVWLLLTGKKPNNQQIVELDSWLILHSQLSARELRLMEQLPRDLHPMLVLQALTPTMNHSTNHSANCTEIEGIDTRSLSGLLISAKLSSVVANWFQLTKFGALQGSIEQLEVKLPGYGVIQQFLSRIHPNKVVPLEWIQALSTTQILQLDHGFNAGTFSGRVTASTLAPVQSSLSASLGTLFGTLHGGADQAAIEMALFIGAPEKASVQIRELLNTGQKVMGMGHREYKVIDPRAKILKPMAKKLCSGTEQENLFNTLEEIEESCRVVFAEKGKDIWANLEFYKGAAFRAMGLPNNFFTATFATARVYGYVAHYYEFSEHSRLIRPQAKYVGAPCE